MKGHAWKQEDRAKPCGTTAPSDKKSTQAITQVGGDRQKEVRRSESFSGMASARNSMKASFCWGYKHKSSRLLIIPLSVSLSTSIFQSESQGDLNRCIQFHTFPTDSTSSSCGQAEPHLPMKGEHLWQRLRGYLLTWCQVWRI